MVTYPQLRPPLRSKPKPTCSNSASSETRRRVPRQQSKALECSLGAALVPRRQAFLPAPWSRRSGSLRLARRSKRAETVGILYVRCEVLGSILLLGYLLGIDSLVLIQYNGGIRTRVSYVHALRMIHCTTG